MKRDINILFIAVVITATSVLLLSNSVLVNISKRDNNLKNTVTAICNWSRDGDTSSERSLCGIIETQTHTEFLCRDDFNCWTEIK